MIESILSSLLGAIGEGASVLIGALLKCISFDVAAFSANFSAAQALYTILRGVGFGAIIFLCAYQYLAFVKGPLTDNADTPPRILARGLIATGLVLVGNHLLVLICNLFSYPYADMIDVNAFSVQAGLTGIINGISDPNQLLGDAVGGTTYALTLLIISFIALVMLVWNLFKLILEVVERYLVLMTLIYTSPLGWAMAASTTTETIFKSWIKMFFSQCAMMLMNVWSFKMILSVLGGSGSSTQSGLLMRLLLALAFCKVAQRIDTYFNQLGANAAITGQNILDDLMAVTKGLQTTIGAFSKGGATAAAGSDWVKDKLGGAFTTAGTVVPNLGATAASVLDGSSADGTAPNGDATGGVHTPGGANPDNPNGTDDADLLGGSPQRSTGLNAYAAAVDAARLANGGADPTPEQIAEQLRNPGAANAQLEKDAEASKLAVDQDGKLVPGGPKAGMRDVASFVDKNAAAPATALHASAIAKTMMHSGREGLDMASKSVLSANAPIQNDVIGAAAAATLLKGATGTENGVGDIPVMGKTDPASNLAANQGGIPEAGAGAPLATSMSGEARGSAQESGETTVSTGGILGSDTPANGSVDGSSDGDAVASSEGGSVVSSTGGAVSYDRLTQAMSATAEGKATEDTGHVENITAGNGQISGTYVPPAGNDMPDAGNGALSTDVQKPCEFSILTSEAYSALPDTARDGYKSFTAADGSEYRVRMAEATVLPSSGKAPEHAAATPTSTPHVSSAPQSGDKTPSDFGGGKNKPDGGNKGGSNRGKRGDFGKRGGRKK